MEPHFPEGAGRSHKKILFPANRRPWPGGSRSETTIYLNRDPAFAGLENFEGQPEPVS